MEYARPHTHKNNGYELNFRKISNSSDEYDAIYTSHWMLSKLDYCLFVKRSYSMHNMELVQKTKIYYGSQPHKNCSDQNFLKEEFDNDDFSERR